MGLDTGMVLGTLTLVVLALQWWVFRRQAGLMERQGEILSAQQALAERQMRWRRDEAIGTFYRIAFDLADEFHNADVLPSTPIPANYETHPRQMLREAARLFAPLGNDVIFTVTEIAQRVDQYFEAVAAYNERPRGRDGAEQLMAVQHLREQVGRNLDRASHFLPDDLRWKYADGKDYDFQKLCSPPPSLLIGPSATG